MPSDKVLLLLRLLQEAMYCRCNDPSCRKAAFDLVAELMAHSTGHLAEGADLLQMLQEADALDRIQFKVRPAGTRQLCNLYVKMCRT